MDGLFTLLCLCLVMATASFLAGVLPLSLSLSPSQLRLVSTLGMGVLVGTSLIVIIPEGVETLYSASSGSIGHSRRNLYSDDLDIRWIQPDPMKLAHRDAPDVDAFLTPGPVMPEKLNVPPPTPTKPGVVDVIQDPAKEPEEEGGHTEDHDHRSSPHAWIGVALISGFILMYLIDKLPHHLSSAKPTSQSYHISLSDLGRRFNRASSTLEESENFLETTSGQQAQSRSLATTTGLVIHAAADGVALGASSSTANKGLSFIIFFAIMVHKAPAAFGLTSILLKHGLSKRVARSHLLLFSLAAPTGALLTWALSAAIGSGVSDPTNTQWWTGMLLLFSGGTFLYVAMHTMQEASPNHEVHTNGHVNGTVESREATKQGGASSMTDLLIAMFGMILPLFLQVGHAH